MKKINEAGQATAMTARAWLSGKAMQDLCANPRLMDELSRVTNSDPDKFDRALARMAVSKADALILELGEGRP